MVAVKEASFVFVESLAHNLGLDHRVTYQGAYLYDFVITAWISLALLVVRYVSERIIVGSPLPSGTKPDAKRKKIDAIYDNLFIAVFSALLEALAVINTLFYNGGCTPWSTDACMVGWPNHKLIIIQRLYFLLMFQYYLYEMIGTLVGVGTMLKTEMIIHHVATMALITLSYRINLLRYGTMWMALFDLSNPLLHLAKAAHLLEVPILKDTMLPLFALVFFVARVAASPYSILKPAFTHAVNILPMHWAVTFIALMIFICILQLFWFYKIVMIALRGDKSEKDKEV